MKYFSIFLSLLCSFVFFNLIVACDHQLSGTRHLTSTNHILKRHNSADKDLLMKKKLDDFERKFADIKNMAWDYKYRRYINKQNQQE